VSVLRAARTCWNGVGLYVAIHCGDELLFGVGMDVSERDRNLVINTQDQEHILNRGDVECRPHLHRSCLKL